MKKLLFLFVVLLTSCSPRPVAVDTSQRINSGVNILPDAVLASMKEKPSTAPTGDEVLDLIDVMQDSEIHHSKWVEVLRTAGLVPTLQEVGPYTVLAPTDEAFDKLPPGVLDQLLLPSHHAQLLAFAKFHLLKGRIDADAMLHTNGRVPTLAGPDVIIKGIGGKIVVLDANVLRSDSIASNGVVHWIDNVLIPPG